MAGDTTRPTLLSRVRDAGDQEAWREFDALYRGLILGYCHRRGLQAADAEDVRQVVMLGLSQSLRRFTYRPELGRFRDYLGRVVHHAVLRHGSGWRPKAEDAEELAEAAGQAQAELDELWEEEWIHHHFRRALAKAQKAFEPRTLEVFEALLAGEAPGEVAARHALSVDAVHKIKGRVREHLSALIAEQVRAEELDDA